MQDQLGASGWAHEEVPVSKLSDEEDCLQNTAHLVQVSNSLQCDQASKHD